MLADGTGLTQVTWNGPAYFAPFMHPNSQQIIFSSNLHDRSGRTFALILVNVDGSGLERVTYGETFASFPVFSRDRTTLVFCGSRDAPTRHAASTSSWPTGPREAAATPHTLPSSG